MKKWILKIVTCLLCVIGLLLVEYAGHGCPGEAAGLVDKGGLLSEQAREKLSGLLAACPANIILERLDGEDVDARFLSLQQHCADFRDKYGMIYIAYSQKNKRVEARMGRTYEYINRSAGAEYKLKYYEIQLAAAGSTPEVSVECMLSHILNTIGGDKSRVRNEASGFLSSFVNNAFTLFSHSLPDEPSFLCVLFRIVTAPVNLAAKLIGSWIIALGLCLMIGATLLNLLFSWTAQRMREPGAYYVKVGITLVWAALCYLTWGALFLYVDVGLETLAVREACGLPDFLHSPVDQFLMFTPGAWGRVVFIFVSVVFYVLAYLLIYAPPYLVYISLSPRLQNRIVVGETPTWLMSYEEKLESFYNMKCKKFDYSDPEHADNFKKQVRKGVFNMIYDNKVGSPPLLLYSIMAIALITDNLFIIFGTLVFCSRGLQWWNSYRNKYREMQQLLAQYGENDKPESLYNLFIRKFIAPALVTGFALLFFVSVVQEIIL